MKIEAELLDLYKIVITDSYGDSVDDVGVVYAPTLVEAFEKAIRLIFSGNYEMRETFWAQKTSTILYGGKYFDISEDDIPHSSETYISASNLAAKLYNDLRLEQKARIKAEFEAREKYLKETKEAINLRLKAAQEMDDLANYERLKKKYGQKQ